MRVNENYLENSQSNSAGQFDPTGFVELYLFYSSSERIEVIHSAHLRIYSDCIFLGSHRLPNSLRRSLIAHLTTVFMQISVIRVKIRKIPPYLSERSIFFLSVF